MTYADSNLLITAALKEVEFGEDARLILRAALRGEINIETCSLTFDEVLWKLLESKDRKGTIYVTENLAKSVTIVFDVSMEVIYETFNMMRETNLAPRDAIHATCMKLHGITEIISEDRDFDKIPGIKRFTISEFARRLKHEK